MTRRGAPRRTRRGTPKPTERRGGLRRIVIGALILAFTPTALGLVAFRWAPVPLTPLMLVRMAQGEGLARNWTALEDMAPAVVRSVVASEDARFCAHTGFDWREIRNAWTEWWAGRGLRGASTISMQTARSVFLWPGRDPVRKGLEILITIPLEGLWPKRRILEVYLNVVEWGPGVYGAAAAARHHFGVAANTLTQTQAARLVAILPAPRRWSAEPPDPHVRQRAATIQARARAVALGERNAPCP